MTNFVFHIVSVNDGAKLGANISVDTVMTKLNTLRLRQNGRHFADDVLKCIFLNENMWISLEISLKFVPEGPINNIPALVQIMAWRRPGDKPLSEPMMVSLLTHICVTRPQWVNSPGQNGQHSDRRHFEMNFLEWKWFRSKKNWHFSQESNWQQASIGLGNGLAPSRRLPTTWTNADPVHWRLHTALGGDKLTPEYVCDVALLFSFF